MTSIIYPMCGRYTLVNLAQLTDLFPWITDPPIDAPARYNIAPSQPILAVANDQPDQFDFFLWGLIPAWAKDPSIGNKLANARAETLAEKPSFRVAFRQRRCLVLADGWYEWMPGTRGKQPYFIQQASGEPFGMAGLWESWDDRDAGERVESCTIVTADAVPAIRHIHDRMPAVLSAPEADRWLDPRSHDVAALDRLLAERETQAFIARPVSRRVNDARNEGPDLVEPVDPAE